MKAFSQYNAIEDRTYRDTGDDRFDGTPDFYRYNTYGSDAAIIMVDARSFRDAELAHLRTCRFLSPTSPSWPHPSRRTAACWGSCSSNA